MRLPKTFKLRTPPAARLRGTISTHLRVYDCPDDLREVLLASLTFENPEFEMVSRYSPWGARNIEKYVTLLEDYEGYVQLPRAFVFPAFAPAPLKLMWESIVWDDLRTEVPVVFPKPRLTLNEDQQAVVERFHVVQKKNLRPSGTQVYVVPTSGGKTVCQAVVASLTGQRCLILAKTALIQKAWKDDLRKLFGIGPKDLGIIQQKNYRIGKHFTVASIATLTRRKHLWHEIFSQIGTLIIDEVQITGSRTVREIVEACPAKYVIGMSATPKRKDAPYLVDALLGKPLLRIENKQEETGSSLPLSDASYIKTNFTFNDEKGKPIDRQDLIYNDLAAALSASKDRDAIVCENARKDWKAGHTVLVTTRRVEHVFELKKRLKSLGVHDVNHLTGDTNGNAFYTDKLLEAVNNKTCRCVVATEQAIAVGANIPALSRLHIAFPPSSSDLLEQLIGRIRRKHPSKKDAKLTYYLDIRVPYLFRKFKSVFIPTMRKLKVPKFEEMYVA